MSPPLFRAQENLFSSIEFEFDNAVGDHLCGHTFLVDPSTGRCAWLADGNLTARTQIPSVKSPVTRMVGTNAAVVWNPSDEHYTVATPTDAEVFRGRVLACFGGVLYTYDSSRAVLDKGVYGTDGVWSWTSQDALEDIVYLLENPKLTMILDKDGRKKLLACRTFGAWSTVYNGDTGDPIYPPIEFQSVGRFVFSVEADTRAFLVYSKAIVVIDLGKHMARSRPWIKKGVIVMATRTQGTILVAARCGEKHYLFRVSDVSLEASRAYLLPGKPLAFDGERVICISPDGLRVADCSPTAWNERKHALYPKRFREQVRSFLLAMGRTPLNDDVVKEVICRWADVSFLARFEYENY